MPRELTAKQLNFCKGVALKGLSLSDAYREAYNVQKMKDKQIHEEASKLNSSPKVSQRIAELKAQQLKSVIDQINYSKLDHFRELHEIKELAKAKDQLSTAGKMTENKGKICGYYEKEEEVPATTIQNQLIVNFIGVEKNES